MWGIDSPGTFCALLASCCEKFVGGAGFGIGGGVSTTELNAGALVYVAGFTDAVAVPVPEAEMGASTPCGPYTVTAADTVATQYVSSGSSIASILWILEVQSQEMNEGPRRDAVRASTRDGSQWPQEKAHDRPRRGL